MGNKGTCPSAVYNLEEPTPYLTFQKLFSTFPTFYKNNGRHFCCRGVGRAKGQNWGSRKRKQLLKRGKRGRKAQTPTEAATPPKGRGMKGFLLRAQSWSELNLNCLVSRGSHLNVRAGLLSSMLLIQFSQVLDVWLPNGTACRGQNDRPRRGEGSGWDSEVSFIATQLPQHFTVTLPVSTCK